jgi:hypothetical protein
MTIMPFLATSDFHKAAIAEPVFEIHEPGDLNFALSAPRCPEVQKDHLAPVFGQAQLVTAGIL